MNEPILDTLLNHPLSTQYDKIKVHPEDVSSSIYQVLSLVPNNKFNKTKDFGSLSVNKDQLGKKVVINKGVIYV